MRRRELLQLAAIAPASWLLACGDNTPDPDAVNAVAVLEPTPSAFLVAVWSASARAAIVRVATLGVVETFALPIGESGSAVLDITDRPADVQHQVYVRFDNGTELGPYRVRTAPADDATRAIRLAVSADLDPDPVFTSDIVDQLVLAAPELYVSIGDFPYTDNGPVAETVDEYRARHAATRTCPAVRTLHAACGMRAIYDDHEFRNNWDAGFAAAEPVRLAAALQVWDEFFPLRAAPPAIRYRSWRWGADCECFLLDCRRFRSADAAPDVAGKTMLGAAQLAWFLAAVTASQATFKLVFTSIPLDFGDGNDDWSSFSVERQTIFDALYEAATPGVLFISGDQHWFAAHEHAYGIREFQIGPVARGIGTPPPPVPGVRFRALRYNIGIIDVVGDQLTFSGLGEGGDPFYSETVTADQLTPKSKRFPR